MSTRSNPLYAPRAARWLTGIASVALAVLGSLAVASAQSARSGDSILTIVWRAIAPQSGHVDTPAWAERFVTFLSEASRAPAVSVTPATAAPVAAPARPRPTDHTHAIEQADPYANVEVAEPAPTTTTANDSRLRPTVETDDPYGVGADTVIARPLVPVGAPRMIVTAIDADNPYL